MTRTLQLEPLPEMRFVELVGRAIHFSLRDIPLSADEDWEPMALNPKIVLAEDSPDDVWLLAHYLAEAGVREEIEVLGEGDCVARLQAIVAQSGIAPRMVVVDLRLRGTDGVELLRQLRRIPQYASTPVIVFSGLVTPSIEARCLADGASACFAKPLDAAGWRAIARQMAALIAE